MSTVTQNDEQDITSDPNPRLLWSKGEPQDMRDAWDRRLAKTMGRYW